MIPQHLSKTQEHYTPAHVVELAREVLGVIDLDPASCEEANATVRAKRIFTRGDDGLTQPWSGRVFLNPPGGTFTAKRKNKTDLKPVTPPEDAAYRLRFGTDSRAVGWWRKLEEEWHKPTGGVDEAVFIGFTLELLRATQGDGVWNSAMEYPFCVPRERLCFGGNQPTHGNVIVYMGGNAARFAEVFARIGMVRT